MEISVAPERILLLEDQITPSEAKNQAWEKKLMAFDAISKVTGFLSRPKDEDFRLMYEEHRYQPFWHVKAQAKYVYDRDTKYCVPVSSSVVKSVTFQKMEYQEDAGQIYIPVTEHCLQEEHSEVLIEGVTGKSDSELAYYLTLQPKSVKGKLEKMVPEKSILVPPQIRVSAIMRDALAKMIKGIQADKILEEHVEVSCVDLYYHPIYAFQYRWESKNKQGILEVDGITGAIKSGSRTFAEYLGRVIDRDFLFDVGADAAGIFIPGGSIAVKVAKRYIDSKKKQEL